MDSVGASKKQIETGSFDAVLICHFRDCAVTCMVVLQTYMWYLPPTSSSITLLGLEL